MSEWEEPFIDPETGEMRGFGVRWYKRDGTPLTNAYEMERLLRTRDYKIVRQEHLWYGAWLSTVWLGLDHSFHFGEDEPGMPIIFETMLFAPGTMHEVDCERYATEATALAGHWEVRRKWRWRPWTPWRVTLETVWHDTWKLLGDLRAHIHEWRHPDLTAAVQELGIETSFEKLMRTGRRLFRHSNIWVRLVQRIKRRGQRVRAALPKVKAKDDARR